MYTLVSAIAKSFASQGRYESVDIGNMTFSQIYSTYTKVYATLSNPLLTQNVTLDLSTIQTTMGGSQITFNQYLTNNGNKTIATSNTLLTLSPQYVIYKDAFKAGFKVTPVDPNAAPDAIVPEADKTHLYITKTFDISSTLDFTDFTKYCMVSVNGFFHPVIGNTQGAWVVNGNVSRIQSRDANIGLLNFQNVGALTYVPITPSMIYKNNDSQNYKDKMNINVGVDLDTKTIILVLGGYLHVLDQKTFYRTGQQTIAVDMANLPIIDRYHESRKWIDYSGLPFDKTNNNVSQVSVPNFMSDENLVAYATMVQSFIMLVDNPDVFVDTIFVRTPPTPGLHIAYVQPDYPLFNGLSKHVNYWSVEEDGQWSLACVDNYWNHRKYYTVDLREQNGVDDGRVVDDLIRYSQGYMLQIGTNLTTSS